MKNNNYALFYRTAKFSTWQSKRPDLPVEKWENYAQEQEYAEYDIKKLDNYDAFDLHLLTDIVYFDGKYYLPQEKIPYPVTYLNILKEYSYQFTYPNRAIISIFKSGHIVSCLPVIKEY